MGPNPTLFGFGLPKRVLICRILIPAELWKWSMLKNRKAKIRYLAPPSVSQSGATSWHRHLTFRWSDKAGEQMVEEFALSLRKYELIMPTQLSTFWRNWSYSSHLSTEGSTDGKKSFYCRPYVLGGCAGRAAAKKKCCQGICPIYSW